MGKCSEVPKQICHLKHKRVPVRVSKKVPKKVCNVPGQLPAEFVPVASPPVPAVALTTPAPVTTTTTDAPSTLDDILNRNEASNTILFDSEAAVDNVVSQLSDKFVFEEEKESDDGSVKFEN